MSFAPPLSRRSFLGMAGCALAPLPGCGRKSEAASDSLGRLANELDAIATRFGSSDMGGISVSQHGTLVLERYYAGDASSPFDIRSAGKSVTSVLAGTAHGEGLLPDLDSSLPRLLPEFEASAARDSRVGAITLRHLLEMKSGFAADEDRPDSPGAEDRWYDQQDWLDYFLRVPMKAAPGTEFAYASMNTALVGLILARTTGRPLRDYFEEKLATPLAFDGPRWQLAPHGDVVPQGNLFLRLADFLSFGRMVLARGRAGSRQLVPSSWIDLSTAMITPLRRPPYAGYGFLWWRGETNIQGRRISFPFASGNGGQKCFIVRELGLVCATTSLAFGQRRGHERAHAMFSAVLSNALMTH